MNSPLVTILMPVHNGAEFLAEAIDSMLCQSLRDFEFLIVDDASTDSSASIVQGYRDPRIRLIQSRERLKLSGALNLGLDQAKGRYIARMDADDISLPKRLERQVQFLDGHPEIGICGSWILYFGASSALLERPIHHEEIQAFTLLDTPFAHPSVMLRRDLMERHPLRFDGRYFPTEDFELWIRILRHTQAANLPEVLLHYRVHAKSLTGSGWSTMDEQAVRIIRNQLRLLGLDPTPDELRFHRQLAMGRLTLTKPLLDQAEAWLLSLLAANQKTQFLPSKALESLLGDLWARTCLHSARLGFEVARCYAGSSLSSTDTRRCRRQWLIRLAALKAKLT
jgi:hypothetical protein